RPPFHSPPPCRHHSLPPPSFCFMRPTPPRSTLFPYTTLFRSSRQTQSRHLAHTPPIPGYTCPYMAHTQVWAHEAAPRPNLRPGRLRLVFWQVASIPPRRGYEGGTVVPPS